MENSKMLKLVLIILCLAGYLASSAQPDFVALTIGDTLTGKVVYLNYGAEPKIQFTDNNKKKTIYSMKQVKGFRINNEDYQLVRNFDRYVYMKLLLGGYLSLYAYQMENQQTWDGRFLYKRDGKGMDVPNIGFKKKVMDFVSECDELSAEISNKDLGRNDLTEIINKYNSCIEQRTVLVGQVVQQKLEAKEKATTWNELETKVKSAEQLNDKETVLEMITEARAKTQKGEKIPRFLIDGLKKSLEGNADLHDLLVQVLKEIEQ